MTQNISRPNFPPSPINLVPGETYQLQLFHTSTMRHTPEVRVVFNDPDDSKNPRFFPAGTEVVYHGTNDCWKDAVVVTVLGPYARSGWVYNYELQHPHRP